MSRKRAAIDLRQFYEAAHELLGLELITGEDYLDKKVQEAYLNRPGLALTGFEQYFANRRIQVLGLAENAYLKGLSEKERKQRLRDFFNAQIPCVILTRNRSACQEMLDFSGAFNVPVFRTPLVTHQFIHSGTVLIESLIAPSIRLQGTMVDIKGIGVLLEGSAGVGKSETALGLIEAGHSLVSDDVTLFRRASWGAVIGSAVDLTRFHMEIRGVGIIHVPSLYGITSVRAKKQLDLIVHLYRPDRESDDRVDASGETREICDVRVPVINIPVEPGRDMAHLIELAALNQRLKLFGHDAAKELDEKIMVTLTHKGATD